MQAWRSMRQRKDGPPRLPASLPPSSHPPTQAGRHLESLLQLGEGGRGVSPEVPLEQNAICNNND